MNKLFVRLAAVLLAGVWCAGAALAQSPKKLLVVTVTKGFRHSSIPTAMKVIGDLSERSLSDRDKSKAFAVDYAYTDQDIATKMTPEALKGYDGFIFANTTGILPLPDKAAFLNEIKNGKAFIGMHSASDTFHGANGAIDPYIEMIGGEFKTHGPQVGVECLVQDRNHPAVKHFGQSFCLQQEEIYQFINHDPKQCHELLLLDKHPEHKDQSGQFGVSWCKMYGQGKVFYTSLGHREDVWENKAYQQHILGGIRWALGLEEGDATPQAK